ncbi:MAG: hypothetical protein ACXVWF_08840 [Actinomycetota bacterium]
MFLYEDDERDPREVIEEIRKYLDPDEGPVFFASTFDDGDFAGFAHFSADGLEALVGFVDGALFDAGVRSDYATEGSILQKPDFAKTPMGPKRKSPRFCAICRVRTTDGPQEVLERIAEEFDFSEPLVGASLVIGTFPLLVELGAEDGEGLTAAIRRLRGVPGVASSTQVATTDTWQTREQGSSA